jgi:arylsulfatase
VPLLTGRNTSTDSTALIEDDQDYLGFRMRTLVTNRYRLTAYSGQPYGELFDFQEDPDEFRNLWDEPDYRSIRDELRIALLDKIMETGSPLPRQFSRS